MQSLPLSDIADDGHGKEYRHEPSEVFLWDVSPNGCQASYCEWETDQQHVPIVATTDTAVLFHKSHETS